MGVVKNLMIRAGADFSSLQKELKKAETFMKQAGRQLTSIGKTMTTAITLPVIGLGAAAFKSASDLQESMNKTEVAFGSSADAVKDWSKTTLKSFGIAQGSALDMAALFGDMSTSMGMSDEEAKNMSMSLVGLAGDLASFKNIGLDQTQTALKSIFTGETESLKNLGIVMTQANLNAYALSQGINKTVQEMTQAEQVQLRYAYVMDMTKNSQGDFARTSDGAANQMRIFTESIKELGASFGEVLLPVITPIIAQINDWVQKFGQLDQGTKEIIVKVALFAAALGPVLMIIGKVATGISAVTKGVRLASAALSAGKGLTGALSALLSPAGLVIAIIAAVAAAAYLIWKNWEPIKEFFINLWTSIKDIAINVWDSIKNFFSETIPNLISDIGEWFADLPRKIGYALGLVIGTLAKWMIEAVDWVKENVPIIVKNVIEFFKELPGKVWDAIKMAVTNLGEWAKDMIEVAKTEIPKIILKILEFFKELPSKIVEIGTNIVHGLWEGISKAWNWLKEKVGGFFTGLVDGIKDGLGIKSPSKVMANQVGKWIPAGISEGILSNKKLVDSAMSSLSSDVAFGLNPSVDYQLGGVGNISVIVELDSYVMAKVLGVPLAEIIRVRTGVKI